MDNYHLTVKALKLLVATTKASYSRQTSWLDIQSSSSSSNEKQIIIVSLNWRKSFFVDVDPATLQLLYSISFFHHPYYVWALQHTIIFKKNWSLHWEKDVHEHKNCFRVSGGNKRSMPRLSKNTVKSCTHAQTIAIPNFLNVLPLLQTLQSVHLPHSNPC